jgi:uncharacterized protein
LVTALALKVALPEHTPLPGRGAKKASFMRISRTLVLCCTVAIGIIGYYTIRVTRAFSIQYGEYHPPREQIDLPVGKLGLRLHDISIEMGDGTRVAGWSLPSNNGAVIIFIHGSTGSRKELLPVALNLNKHGYGAILLDMPGHGESGGRADWGISSQVAVERAIDLALKGDGVRHVAIFGFSMGTYIAVEVAARDRRVAALVLLGAFTNLADQIRYQFRSHVPFLNEINVLVARMVGVDGNAIRTLDLLEASASRPILIIAGTADGLIPVSMPQALFQAAHEPKELWLVEGANHLNVRDTADPAIFDQRVSIFLDRALFAGDVDLSH